MCDRGSPAQRVAAFILTFGLAFAAGAANAVVIPTAPSELVVNFDFTSPPQTPAPPYVSGNTLLHVDQFEAGETAILQAFDGLNGSGALIFDSLVPGDGIYIIPFALSSGFHDGIFSFTLSMNEGLGNLVRAESTGTGDTSSVTIQGVVSTQQVPEPSALALLVIVLAGLAFSRRRKLH